jgi:hypothetical protein
MKRLLAPIVFLSVLALPSFLQSTMPQRLGKQPNAAVREPKR